MKNGIDIAGEFSERLTELVRLYRHRISMEDFYAGVCNEERMKSLREESREVAWEIAQEALFLYLKNGRIAQ